MGKQFTRIEFFNQLPTEPIHVYQERLQKRIDYIGEKNQHVMCFPMMHSSGIVFSLLQWVEYVESDDLPDNEKFYDIKKEI